MKTKIRLEKLIKEREENTLKIKEFQKKQKRLNRDISQAMYYIRTKKNQE